LLIHNKQNFTSLGEEHVLVVFLVCMVVLFRMVDCTVAL